MVSSATLFVLLVASASAQSPQSYDAKTGRIKLAGSMRMKMNQVLDLNTKTEKSSAADPMWTKLRKGLGKRGAACYRYCRPTFLRSHT